MIAHVDNRITYSGNGNATEFAYQFKILDRTDIKVLLTDADGKEKLLTKDYYVDVEKNVVRYPGYAVGAEVPESERPAVLPTGWKLTIYREVPVTQETDLPDQYPFNQVEDIGDKLTMIAQQLTDATSRSLKISVNKSADIDTTIPWENGKSFRISDDGANLELTEDPGKVIDGATALLKQTTEQAESANEAATNAQNAATTAEKIANDLGLVDEAVQTAVASATTAEKIANDLGLVDEAVQTAVASATTASEKSDIATSKADIATAKASEASASADTATQKANAANTSATNAAQSYTNANAIATQLTEYLATKETVTAPAVDKTLLIEGAAADSKVVGELKGDISDISDVIPPINLIDPTTIVDNSLWKQQNPESGNYSRSGLIKVKPNTVYTFGNTDYMYWDITNVCARFVAYFDANGTYNSNEENITTFTTPNLCEYVAVTFLKNARNVVLLEGSYNATTQTMVYVPFADTAKKLDGQSINNLTTDKIDDYAVPSKNLFDISKARLNAFLQAYPSVSESLISFVSDYIPVKANVSYVISNDYITGSNDYSCRSYVLYDNQFQKVSGKQEDVKSKVVTPTVDGYLRFCGYSDQKDRTQVEVGTTPTPFEPFKIVLNNSAMLNNSQLNQVGNVLYGKKWVVCGDSFTNSGGTGTKLTQGRYIGRDYTYPWIIGNRQNMEIVKFFEGGRTLAFPANPASFANSLTNPNAEFYYQNIPADVDYITIYLGINDEHHATGGGDGEDSTGVIPLGTIDDADTSTYYGAWNEVLTWLITNRPNAHIGIIVTNGLSIEAYRTAQIEIARKYGIPFIDMNGDDRTPAMLRTVNPNIATSVKQALIAKWAVDPTGTSGKVNTHPNDDAQLFESYFIEDFLKSI